MAKATVFETLRPGDAPALRRLLDDGREVYFLNPDSAPPEDAELTELEKDGRIRRLNIADPLYVNNDASVAPALDAVDRVYAREVRERDGAIGALARLYDSEDVHLAFKKQLLEDLWRRFHCRMLLEQIDAALPDAEAEFVPADPADAALLARFSEVFDDAPTRTRVVGAGGLRKRDLRAAALTLYVSLRALWSWLRSLAATPDRTRFSYAIAVVSPVREFANRYRAPDALLDGKTLTRDNTVFVPLVPLSSEQLEELSDRGLHTVIPFAGTPTGLCARLLFHGPLLALRLLLSPGWTAPAAAALFKEYWIWSTFTSTTGLGKFLFYADFHYRQIGRNALLKRRGIETWYYLDTENLGALNLVGEKRPANLHPFWSFLAYDRCLTWSDRLIEYYRRHKQAIGRYDAIGVVWGEPVKRLRESAESAKIAERLAGPAEGARQVVAVFDSTYNNLSRTTYEDGAQFAAAFEKLLEDFPDVTLLWKEKKPRDFHPKTGSFGLVEIYDRLARHPRCRFLDSKTPSEEVLAAADLCVCFPFTSSAAELMSAGGRGLYFAPNAKFGGSYFSEIPGLVAHNYDELRDLTRRALHETSDIAYRVFLESEIKGRLDPYLDGGALTRLRRLLAEK